ncbi:MAG: phage portal protein [Butyricicoccus sp.]
MLFQDTETARFNRIIETAGGTGLTEREFFAREIFAWETSAAREEQIKGEAYYAGEHDIKNRKREAIGKDGKLQEVKNLPNYHVVDNQYGLMVDQKANYLCGKPFSVTCENEQLAKQLSARFNRKFQRLIRYTAADALNGGIAWLYVHYDREGNLAFRRLPAYQVLPFWADDDHTVLDAAARLYLQEVWDGLTKKTVKRVELYKPEGLYRYVLDGSVLIPDVEQGEFVPYISVPGEGEAESYSWQRFPLIPFKRNLHELPLLRNVKSLQDGINLMLSDFENGMAEDNRNTILVLKNYDGQDLGEFRQNLSTYSAVKVRDDGGVETLQIEVNSSNYQAIVEVFKKALIQNARGYDAKDDRLSGSPNQMNIQSMYSDIDLDANGMETEFQAALEDVLWFIVQDMKTKGEGDFTAELDDITIVFNRDILINESEAIENCAKSAGILSTQTIVEQHPWTKDAQTELGRLEQEKQDTLSGGNDYAGTFGQTNDGNDE